MKILFAIHNAYTDNTSGAARSLRTIIEWLAEWGHECRVVSSTRFDGNSPADFETHLATLEINPHRAEISSRLARSGARPGLLLEYILNRVRVQAYQTQYHDLSKPDKAEFDILSDICRHQLKNFQPDLLITYGGHPVCQDFMKQARQRNVRTLYSVRNYGYEDKRWFQFADHVLTCSPFLTDYYQNNIGQQSYGIYSPLDWKDIIAPDEARAFLTFVNPSLSKGAGVFARLADMLGKSRPDIPILVVQSSADATSLNSIPGIDFSQYPQIMAAPCVPKPADYLELTRVLLVPSVFAEPFGRVAAEAMINGVPPLVSDRGSLPDTVGDGGFVLPLPNWLQRDSVNLPEESEIKQWYDLVCKLWDDEEYYRAASERALQTARLKYAEDILKGQYKQFFELILT